MDEQSDRQTDRQTSIQTGRSRTSQGQAKPGQARHNIGRERERERANNGDASGGWMGSGIIICRDRVPRL